MQPYRVEKIFFHYSFTESLDNTFKYGLTSCMECVFCLAHPESDTFIAPRHEHTSELFSSAKTAHQLSSV